MKHILALISFMLLAHAADAQIRPVLISITDAETGRPLPFVNVQIAGENLAGTSNERGEVTVEVAAGTYVLRASYLGYAPLEQTVRVGPETNRISLALTPDATTLETVTVSSQDARDRLETPLMGVERLSIGDIEVLPVALGEVDVFRGLQLLGGVSSAGEASNGLSVRGGTIDQNLVLFDGAPIFTPTHLFGLFSVFTPDAIGGVDLYRANIPSRFGGRISSVVDVRSRTPTSDKFKMQGGIGLVSSRLSVETPLTKDKKLRLLAGGRAGLNDFLFGLVERLRNTKSRFYDATAKMVYTPNDKHRVTLSGFYSKDFYEIDLENRFEGIVADANQNDYFTLNGTAEWLWLPGDKTSLRTQAVRSNHVPRILFPQRDDGGTVAFESRIKYHSLRSILDLRDENGRLAGGVQLVRYDLSPGALDPGGVAGVRPVLIGDEQAVEASVFGEYETSIGSRLKISAGLRYTHFVKVGPGERRTYASRFVRDGETLEEVETVASGPLADAGGLEPRLGLTYLFSSAVSLKAAYARNRQYLHNIFNATTPLPTSRWALSDNNLRPQTADLLSLGAFLAKPESDYEFSVEGYFRRIDDLVDYRPGAEFFLNPTLETDVLQGRGEAYGVELGARKRRGKLTGEINYAYARSRNRVAGPDFRTSINRGEWYDGYFDQPHTFSSNLTLDDGKTHRISLNFVVQSNRPYSVPNGFVEFDGTPIPLFLERNNARLPVYHRLDFSWTLHNAKMEKRRWVGDWTVTLYNVYGRDNAYNIYYQPREPGVASEVFGDSPLGSYQLTIFGAPIVSLSYSFKFE